MAISERNLQGLLRLLEDTDGSSIDELVNHVSGLPAADLGQLRRLAASSPVALANVARAGDRAMFRWLESDWARLAATSNPGLEAGLTLISRTLGDEAAATIAPALDELADQVGARLAGDRAFDNGLGALAGVLTGRGFRGNATDYYNPGNSYLSTVLSQGLGIPISLCCVAILVGQRLELPVHGIGTPGHFLGFYGDPYVGHGTYFDPFAGFKALQLGDIQRLLTQVSPQPVDMRLARPATNREILSRTLLNLVGCHEARDEPERAQALRHWLELLNSR
ncbi:MAG: transglutaminase family protein [Planctomycetes bacterium]|nr:transglutaminase family protein [Planctomycetota bacterium]